VGEEVENLRQKGGMTGGSRSWAVFGKTDLSIMWNKGHRPKESGMGGYYKKRGTKGEKTTDGNQGRNGENLPRHMMGTKPEGPYLPS